MNQLLELFSFSSYRLLFSQFNIFLNSDKIIEVAPQTTSFFKLKKGILTFCPSKIESLIFFVFGSVRLEIDGEKTLETSLDWIFNFGALLRQPTKGKILKIDKDI